jgi:hypothetical protein
MDVLIDMNMLVRRINRHDPQCRDARSALNVIEARGDRICIAHQNIRILERRYQTCRQKWTLSCAGNC